MARIVLTTVTLSILTGCSKPSEVAGPATNKNLPTAPAEKTQPPATPDDKSTALAAATPDFKFTAQAWYDEFKKDSQSAHTKYKGKVIEVEGVVDAVFDQPEPPLSLITFKIMVRGLPFRAACSPADLWKKVIPGSKTVVRGYLDRLDGELFPCVLVSTDGKAESYKAIDIGAEFAKNKDAAFDKFDGKFYWIEGKVLKIVDTTNDILLYLEGSGGIDVECRIMRSNKKSFDAHNLKPGQSVRTYGNVRFTDGPMNMGLQLMMTDTRIE